MALRRRFALLLAAIVVLLALGGITGAALLARSNAARARHDRQLGQVATAEQLRAAYLAEAAATRAFLLTGDVSQLSGRDAGHNAEGRLAGELAAGATTAEEAATLERLASSANRWETEAVEPLIALRRIGNVDTVVARYNDVGSFELFAAIETQIDTVVSQFTAAAKASNETANTARRDAAAVAIAVFTVAVVLVATTAIAVRRWVTRPLARLGAAVRGLRSGDESVAVPATGPPEIAALGQEIEEMRQRIAVELDITLRSQEGLAQNAAVLMSVRSRLESAPELMPSGWSVAADLTPATGVVAGDCYDIGWIRPSRLGLVVVDVAGHGAESAVVALRSKELLRAAMRTYVDLGEGVRWASQQLDALEPDMFVTAFVATVDTATGALEYVGAGHPPALLCGAGGTVELPPTGPIIGPFEAVWSTKSAVIEEGQTLLVYTDGLTEVRDADRIEFGLDRLRDLLNYEFDNAEAAVKRCLDETAAFSALRGHDDVTLVAVCRNSADWLSADSDG